MPESSARSTEDGKVGKVKSLWDDAAKTLPPPQTASKAPAAGVNLRLNLLKALQATWETAELAIDLAKAWHTPADVATWLKIPVDVISAARSIYSSLVQRMRPIDYVTYVILSKSTGGITKAKLREDVTKFLNDSKSQEFAWYFGMREKLLDQARAPTKLEGWFELVLNTLHESDMIDLNADNVTFRPRNFEFGWKE